MGLPVSRVGDIGMGTCSAHVGTVSFTTIFLNGAENVLVDGMPAATKITIGMTSCGHTTMVVTASTIADAEGYPVHRQGDIGIAPGGIYQSISGSSITEAGG